MANIFGARKRLAIFSGVALAVVVGGAAFAYWTQSGSGQGSATTGNIDPITINQTSDNLSATMWPGSGDVTLSGDYTNPNASKVYVHQISVVVDPTWTSSAIDAAKPACTFADFTVSAPITINAEVDSGTSVNSWSGLTIRLDDRASNQDNCKDVTPTLLYTSN
ncbi:MAG: hypothetical protein WCK58_16790 [Chloroflexota bacterium]